MNRLIKKIRDIAGQLAAEQGELHLFGLFLREESAPRWDLVVSAPWAAKNRYQTMEQMDEKLRHSLTRRDLAHLAAIIVIEPGSPDIKRLRKRVQGRPLPVVLRNIHAFGMDMLKVIVLAAKPYQARSSKPRSVAK